ncbi:MAG: HNH endonuclease [Limisphaerales bacterium]
MTALFELRPTQKLRVMDLVSEAGIDVSDWANFSSGKALAARNPKYCFEPSFVEPKKVLVVNLWFEKMRQQGQDIVTEWKIDDVSDERGRKNRDRIKSAIRDGLPIRVIVLDGKLKRKKSNVSARKLDPSIWGAVYDGKTGVCKFTRGVPSNVDFNESAVDDLAAPPEGNQFPDRGKGVVGFIKRDAKVRAYVVKRAKGKCEHCGVRGFPTANGRFYVETHHIIALCDSGRDTVDNVIALCPQHHRQAHYGVDAVSLEAKFVARLKESNKR